MIILSVDPPITAFSKFSLAIFEIFGQPSIVVKKDDECTVKAQKVFDEETQETLLYCHSTRREKKDQAIGDRFVKRFEENLHKLDDGLHKKKCLKKYDKVMVKIGRLREKYSTLFCIWSCVES